MPANPENTPENALGELLKEFRIKRDLSLEDVSRELEKRRLVQVHYATISRHERGSLQPNEWHLKGYSEVYELNIADQNRLFDIAQMWSDNDTQRARMAEEMRTGLFEINSNVAETKQMVSDLAGVLNKGNHALDGTTPRPHQISQPVADFTGRITELNELIERVEGEDGVTICGITGMGGVGKTELAKKLAEQIRDQYPDGQIFVDLKGIENNSLKVPEIMARVIRSFNLHECQIPEDEGELKGMYSSVLYGKRVLLLMDNASTREQVEPLIPPSTCLLIVTSRQHFTLPGLHSKDLNTLPLKDAERLLLRIAPRIAADAKEIAKLCGTLPLALRLAASAIAKRPDLTPEQYIIKFEKYLTGLGTSKMLSELSTELEASLRLSYDLLNLELSKFWRTLAVFLDSFDVNGAASVLALDSDAAHDMLGELHNLSLVEWSGRYKLHDLSRVFAYYQLQESERDEANKLHSEYYAEVLRQADALHRLGDVQLIQGLMLWDVEVRNIRAGQAWAEGHSRKSRVARELCSSYAAGTVISLRLHPRDCIRWIESGLAAARWLNDKAAEGAHLGNLGSAYYAIANYREARKHQQQSLDIARDVGDRQGESSALLALSSICRDLGEYRQSIKFNEQSIAIAREIADGQSMGMAMNNLGNIYRDLGEYRQAIKHHEQSLAIAREIGNRQSEGNALINLGVGYHSLGELGEAIDYYEQGLVITREIGYQQGEGIALSNLGRIYVATGDHERAKEYGEQSLAIAREIGDRQGECNVHSQQGGLYMGLGEYDEAVRRYQQSLDIAREIGDRRSEGVVLGDMAISLIALGDRDAAFASAEEAIQIFDQLGVAQVVNQMRNMLDRWRGSAKSS